MAFYSCRRRDQRGSKEPVIKRGRFGRRRARHGVIWGWRRTMLSVLTGGTQASARGERESGVLVGLLSGTVLGRGWAGSAVVAPFLFFFVLFLFLFLFFENSFQQNF